MTSPPGQRPAREGLSGDRRITGRAIPFAEMTPRLTGTGLSGKVHPPRLNCPGSAGALPAPQKAGGLHFWASTLLSPDLAIRLPRGAAVKLICATATSRAAAQAQPMPSARP